MEGSKLQLLGVQPTALVLLKEACAVLPALLGIGALAAFRWSRKVRQFLWLAARGQREYRVVGINIFPVKSMAAMQVQKARFDAYGLVHDRRFAVTTSSWTLVSQREKGRLAFLRPKISAENLTIVDTEHPELGAASVSLACSGDEACVEVVPNANLEWGSFRAACVDCGDEVARWLTATLDWPAVSDVPKYRLVQMAGTKQEGYEASPRRLRSASSQDFSEAYEDDDKLAFQDSSPLLITTTASLGELNQRLRRKQRLPVPMMRFRPNIVVEASEPFVEDWWSRLSLRGLNGGTVPLRVAKPCHRCVVTTKPQEVSDKSDSVRGVQPLKELKEFRLLQKGKDASFGAHPCFGVNVALGRPEQVEGAEVCVGDELVVDRWTGESVLAAPDWKVALRG